MAKAKKEKDTALTIKAETAFVIASELKETVDKIIEAGGECDDETMEALKLWQGKLEHKAENIGMVKLRLENDIEYYKAVEEAARSRRKARENAIARLKKYLLDCMNIAKKDSIKADGGLFNFTICSGRAKLKITDQNKLPLNMVDIMEVISPKNDKLKAALEAGEKITGAEIEYGADYIMITGGK